jgi:TolB protein
MLAASLASAQTELTITKTAGPGLDKPTLVSLSGFSGEVASVIQFDLYVQGFKFVSPEEAQYLISGSHAGNVQGRVTDRLVKQPLFSRSYSGASLRRQAHAFTDDVVQAIRPGSQGIAQTRIACKVESGANTEIYVADFDGFGATSITGGDKTLAKSPAWVPGRSALLYTSYKRGRPEIFRHDTSTGSRAVVAGYGGSNLMPAPSPDGSRVAMVLSKSGMVDLYVANADGSNLKQLTRSTEYESSPCWSPDGNWICFATQLKGGGRVLAKVSPAGGDVQRIRVAGVSRPSEPDWSPDGKWIAFTAQMGSFQLCVVPAEGGAATALSGGDDPSWAPNSRTVIFTRHGGGRQTLSLLDVPTKQVKDVPRISGSNNSQPAWAR